MPEQNPRGSVSRLKRLRAAIERALAPGYGTCGHCGRPWKFAEGHMTPYAQGRRCFPLCEDCWSDLATPEARLPFYRDLHRRWVLGWAFDPFPPVSDEHRASHCWENVERAVMEGL